MLLSERLGISPIASARVNGKHTKVENMSSIAETDNKRDLGGAPDEGPSERSAWRRDSAAHDVSARLGQRIRQHREAMGMSLAVASKATGIPAATLSRIENNRMAPTMPVVLKLMAGLRITWAGLMAPLPPEPHESQISIALPGEGEVIDVQGNTYTVPHATSRLNHQIQPVIFDISSKTVEEAGGLRGHSGTELCYVLSGILVMHFVDRAPAELGVGASVLFNGEIPHAYVAKGRGPTRVLLFNAIDPLMRGADEMKPLISTLRQSLAATAPPVGFSDDFAGVP
ncbi:transcriptional regulator with XRE-family HTH domain [Sphingopyxis panaciterrae]|uniref:helix-turn-helix domain-containing protein n=1 Tax=Sphingopyxis panaciterrae TaxID=363841 RepID=UPI00141DC559|nr:XRE family transcriptional regulator [Sphingopyxis panaciterrae]NIJ37546.1 transcriptional regulator with XRE-family HTH domain [Sphingopyxis panaciterrae]